MLQRERLEAICNAYYSDVFRFCLFKTKDAEAAAELTQDTFLLLQQKAAALQETHIKAWLLQTANNLIYAFWREQKRKRNSEVDLEKAEQLLETQIAYLSEDTLSDSELQAIGEEILETLSQPDRELYQLRYKHNMKYADIAEVLGVKENTVQVRAFRLRMRVLQRIRTKLGREEVLL